MNYKLSLEEWIYNKYHIWRYDLPSREVIQMAYHWAMAKPSEIPGHTPKRYKHRKYQICELYAFGNYTIEDISDIYVVTRTRVRTVIWRVYWEYTRRFNKQQEDNTINLRDYK